MTGWMLVPSLVQLRSEFDIIAPTRAKGADGSIGDVAHQQRVSDHNRDESGAVPVHDADHVDEVHAIDVTTDLNQPGLTLEMAVQFLVTRCRLGFEERLRYIIFNKRIWRADNDWRQEPYTLADPHTGHAHFSASYDTAHEADTRTWYLEDLVALTDTEIEKIATATAAKVWAYKLDNPQVADDPKNPAADDKSAGVWLQYVPSFGRVDSVGAKVDVLAAALKAEPEVDEAAVAKAILAGLPDDLAKQIVDEISGRLDQNSAGA